MLLEIKDGRNTGRSRLRGMFMKCTPCQFPPSEYFWFPKIPLCSYKLNSSEYSGCEHNNGAQFTDFSTKTNKGSIDKQTNI